jgi:hypothetical protein
MPGQRNHVVSHHPAAPLRRIAPGIDDVTLEQLVLAPLLRPRIGGAQHRRAHKNSPDCFGSPEERLVALDDVTLQAAGSGEKLFALLALDADVVQDRDDMAFHGCPVALTDAESVMRHLHVETVTS